MVTANMSGSDKKPLLCIGKYRQPRCFPKDKSKLPVDYKHSQNSWMTSHIYTEWLHNWDTEMRQKGRKILLFVDNCTAHPEVELTNIRVFFLPPNTTSLIQPMDQGIIKNLKGHYRSKLATRLISELDSDRTKQMKDLFKNINLLDAIHLMSESWSDVKQVTIANCFRHGGFKKRQDVVTAELEIFGDIELPEEMSLDDLLADIEIDSNMVIPGSFSDEELVQEAKRRREQEDMDSEEEEEFLPEEVTAALKVVRKSHRK